MSGKFLNRQLNDLWNTLISNKNVIDKVIMNLELDSSLNTHGSEAIILGANHHNTYGIIRALHKAKIFPIVVCFETDASSNYFKSRYVKRTIFVEKSNLLNWLVDYGKKSAVKHTIFSSGDYFTSILDSNANELSKYFYFPHSQVEGELNYLMDKQKMSELALSCGLNVPPHSHIFSNTLNINKLNGGGIHIF